MALKEKLFFLFSISCWILYLPLISFPLLDHNVNPPNLCTHFDWGYNPITSTLSVNIKATRPGTPVSVTPFSWVGWGINPSGSNVLGTQLEIFTKDNHSSFMVNSSSYEQVNIIESEGEVVEYEAGFFHDVIKVFVQIALPEKSDSINYVVMVGGSIIDGKPNLNYATDKHFGVLNLTQPKESKLVRFVEGLVEGLSFKKGCTFERNSIWNSITHHNFSVAAYYCFGIVLIYLLCKGEPKMALPENLQVIFPLVIVYTLVNSLIIKFTFNPDLVVASSLMNIQILTVTFFLLQNTRL